MQPLQHHILWMLLKGTIFSLGKSFDQIIFVFVIWRTSRITLADSFKQRIKLLEVEIAKSKWSQY